MKITISAKCSDLCYTEFETKDGVSFYEEDGYAPDIPELCGGDYVEFTVDVETGQIIGWNTEKVKDAIRDIVGDDFPEE